MSDRLYEPLQDIDAYLERIGISTARNPSREFLDELIDAHQRTVPFENLEMFEQCHAPSLAKADLFDKIVTRRRGGYCFELNGLFFSLLQGLGFDARPCMARVLTRPNPHPMISHRATIVSIDGTDYLADVGFGGPMPSFAPAIEEGVSRTELGQTFTLRQHDNLWWNVCYTGSSAEEKPVMRFCTMPVEEQDFVLFSFFQSENPQSVFRAYRRANVRTADGAYDLNDMTFTEFSHGERIVIELADDKALDRVLAEKFGITDWR